MARAFAPVVALLAFLPGCVIGSTKVSGVGGTYCQSDSDCGSSICSRFGTCVDPAQAMTISATWTITGMTASTTACNGIDHLEVDYLSGGAVLGGFAPVPCNSGKVHFDKLPANIDTVRITELSPSNGSLGVATGAVQGPANDASASIDLPAPQ